jgi:uncharacterized repeat protein (TIGR02543 family)
MAGRKRSGLAYHRRAYTYSTTTYTVTYDGNTNTSGNTPINGSSSYASGSTITILGNSGSPVLAKTGFTFAGWNTLANGSGTSYSQGNTITINNNITLYAQWTAAISAPTSLSGVGGNTQAYILFTQSGTVTNYEYSTDNGSTFLAFNPPQIYSPVNITTLSVDGTTPLENETTYTVKLRAVNSGASSSDSVSVDVVPTITSLLSTNRIIYLDANNSSSYTGNGNTWTNLDSGGSFSATLIGSPTFDETNSGNKYFEFNTGVLTGQYAQIAQDASINPVVNRPFTIQMWVKINNIGAQGTLVSKMYNETRDYDGYNFIYNNDSALQLHLNGALRDNRFISTTGVLSSGWALYTANVQFGNGGGRTNNIFVNGRQVLANTTSTEVNIASNNQVLTIAAGFGGDGECDVGQFYYYYDSQLTETQIIQNFDATKSRYI